ncbi:hypothetical protein M201_gp42 [Haloarcula californiae tailed virus 2]|uniref:Uncharacterized protein n=1 Tax=Haloarcula californiae tailed virus 2 TaxID=1273747 RepID=R4T7V0_9CAUD|nr:hypothetical protein M201_gp42 [Haloarcula californiae tailed virus 2]AGM11859.1 hypothetical protein HCTV2_48 [Haloarcula californiae tailed virus 2]
MTSTAERGFTRTSRALTTGESGWTGHILPAKPRICPFHTFMVVQAT